LTIAREGGERGVERVPYNKAMRIQRNGGASQVMMMSSDAGLLSARVSAIWIAALCVVLVFHCGHLIRMHGERRWYHCAHVAMLLGMLYMYASVAFGLELLPAHVWLTIYVATSAAIIIWIWERSRQRRSFGHLWIVALVQQGAMIYMWAPMNYWLPLVSYAFAAYFALETSAWLTRACIKPAPGAAVAGAGGSLVMPLAHRSVRGDICMAIMAASMGYMFVGMQLMMSLPRQSEQLAQQPQQSASSPSHYESGIPTLAQAPKVTANESAKSSAETSPPASAESYTIVTGDSLRRIATRLYGDARQWRRIMKANPGVHPRHLRIGQVIKLPMVLSPAR
jgi:LysM repeat protein